MAALAADSVCDISTVTDYGKLNPAQCEAIEKGLSQRATLIQGPPGTGKTDVLGMLVKALRLLHNPRGLEANIYVGADSNSATQDAVIKAGIKSQKDVVRCGQKSKVRLDLQYYSLDIEGARLRQFTQSSVVCATVMGITHRFIEEIGDSKYPWAVVDEAAQMAEVNFLPLLSKGCTQFIQIGDQEQLPPVIASRDAVRRKMGLSLFERLGLRAITPVRLNVQYRMHPGIAAWPSEAFYDEELEDGVTAEERSPPTFWRWPRPDIPVCFVDDSSSKETACKPSSYTNENEANIIQNIVRKALTRGMATRNKSSCYEKQSQSSASRMYSPLMRSKEANASLWSFH